MPKKSYSVTVDLLENYKLVRQLRSEFLSRKYRPFYRSRPKYKLFEFEHPYYEMEAQTKNAVNSFELMIKQILDVEIDGGSVRNELNKMTTMLILSEKTDAVIERLRKL
jgi:hypothetical protein